MSDQHTTLTPSPGPAHALHHKLSSSSLSMSIPPDSPPTSHDFELAPAPSQLPTSARGASTASNLPAQQPAQVPFPSSINGENAKAVQLEAGGRVRSSSTRSCSSAGGANGNAVLAELARALQDKYGLGPDGVPRTQEEMGLMLSKDELEAMFVAAQQVITDSERDLQETTDAGRALSDENKQLRSRHESLLGLSSPPRTRSSVTYRARTHSPASSIAVADLRERQITSPSLNRPWQQQSHSGSSSATRVRASSDASMVGSSPSSPTSSRYSYLGTAGASPTAANRHRVASNASVASIFAPAPRVLQQSQSSSAEMQQLNHTNYQLTLHIAELEAEAARKEQDGKKKLRRVEKELQSLQAELNRVEERNAALEHPSNAADNIHRRRSTETEQTPRIPVRVQPKSSTLVELGVINNFAPPTHMPAAPSPPSAPNSPASIANGGKQGARREPSLISAPNELVSQLMSKVAELQRENSVIENGRLDFAERLEKAQDEVDQFKRKCEQLEDELENTNNFAINSWQGINRQPSITWRDEEDLPSPTRLKGNRREIERRANQRNRKISTTSSRSVGDMSFSYSDKSLAESARMDSPTPGQRLFGSQLREMNGPAQGRTLESELGDGTGWGDDRSMIEHEFNEHSDNFVDEQHSFDDSLDYSEEQSTIGTDSTSTPSKLKQRTSTAHHALIPPGSLRRSGPPDSSTYENISRVASSLKPVWEDEAAFPLPPKPKVNTRSLPHALLRSLEWAREGGPVEDEDEGEDLWDESQYPEKDEHNFNRTLDHSYARERVARLSYSSLRSRSRGTDSESRMKRIASGVPGWRDGDSPSGPGGAGFGRSLSRRDIALRRLGLEVDEGELADCEEVAGSEDERSGWSEEELGVGVARQDAADYYPISLRARYAPKMMASRILDRALASLQTVLTYLQFFIVLLMAFGWAVTNGPEKMGFARRQRRIRSD